MGINIYMTVSAPGYGGNLAVCATDESGKRKYMRVGGLKNPDYSKWNKNLQFFLPDNKVCNDNNAVLMELRISLELLVRNGIAKNPEHLFYLYKQNEAEASAAQDDGVSKDIANKAPTLGEYLEKLVNEMRDNGMSCNYQLYFSLFNNLSGISKKTRSKEPVKFKKPTHEGLPLLDFPISDISNAHLASFRDWIIKVKNGVNYRGLTVILMATLRRAQEQGLNKNDLTYSFTKNKPKTGLTSLSGAVDKQADERALTDEQLKNLFDLNYEKLGYPKDNRAFNCDLYLDTAKLMYLLMSRPADVVSMRWDMIATKDNKNYLCYIPFKKRNLSDPKKHIVRMPICDEAMALMEKYRPYSDNGFILPFQDNKRKFDITTPDGMRQWSLGLARSIRLVDTFLKKVGAHIGMKRNLSLYTLRRTAITRSLDAGENVMTVAKRAGTGLNMIDKHYYIDVM